MTHKSCRAVFVVLLSGCGAAAPPEPPPGANPIVGQDFTGSAAATPFPSAFYEVADPSTPTGVRVSVPVNVLPATNMGIAFQGAQMNGRDGFSPLTPFIVYFKGILDGSKLPPDTDPAASLAATAQVQIFESKSGQRVPLFAELDKNAKPENGDRQALVIHPLRRLENGKTYVIALVGLTDTSGKPILPAPFKALRDKGALNKALSAMKTHYEDIFTLLASAGVARSSLSLAWDVTIGSDDAVSSHLVGMRDQALPMVPSLHYTITQVNTPTDPNLWREIIGTFDVPSFLSDDSKTATLNLDASGHPALRGIGSANFAVHVPVCAKTATTPVPVIIFGHGIFGNAHNELNSDYQKKFANTVCMVQVGTDWIGLSSDDFTAIASNVLSDFNKVPIITDRLQQAQVNAQVLTRLFLTSMKSDAQITGGAFTVDASKVYYYGISLGGIEGGTFMALSQDIVRGVLNVPGGEWSMLIFRSHDFARLTSILNSVYPDALDQQVLVAGLQSFFDYTDPINFAPHVIGAPFPSTPAKHILAQEAIGDAAVTNISTRILVRALGLPGLDLEQPVYGVDAQAAPLDSAYTQWDIHPMPLPPDEDVPPPDNSAHGGIRELPKLVSQIQAFFTPSGQVTSVCNGPCVF